MDVTLPDGTVIKDVPDGMSKTDLTAKLKANGYDTSKLETPAAPTVMDRVQTAVGSPSDMLAGLQNFTGKNALMGGLQHAANIGATVMQPFQWAEDQLTGKTAPTLSSLVTGQKSMSSNEETRAGIKGGVLATGADPNSLAFKTAGTVVDAAGTAGAGGALGKVAGPILSEVAPTIGPKIANALASNGFTLGAPAAATRAGAAGDLAIRSLGGGLAGGAQAALVDPEHAGTAATIGAALPGALKVAAGVGGLASDLGQAAAQRLMQSALKPTLAQLKSGEAATAVQTLLKYGINATEGGVNKLKGLIADLNDQVSTAIEGSSATVNKGKVVNALADTRTKFGNQVSPTNDLATIDSVQNDFLNHPTAVGADIPVQQAQKLKQGTYQVLKGKYGEVGSADTEAQKSLARGLKDEIAAVVPGVGDLNAEESKLLTTLSVTERRALMDANKNPGGLSLLAHNPLGWAAFMADKSAGFKSVAARLVNAASQGTPGTFNALAGPAAFRALPRVGQN